MKGGTAMYIDDDSIFSASNVFDALGIRYDGSKRNVCVICPKCGKSDFYMDLSKNFGHCYRASCDFKANQTSYYATARGISNADARKEMRAYMGVSFDERKKISSKRKIKQIDYGKEAPIADIDVRDQVNREIIKMHPFIARHVNDMKKRGLTDEEIKKLHYCSFGYQDETKLAESFLSKGLQLKGVPGFYKNDAGMMQLRELKKGILIPFRSSENKIQGFQLRKNNESLKTWVENGEIVKEKKCNWLSSNGLNEGTKIPSYCHYACDFIYDFLDDKVYPVIKNHSITITEGGMKGDIIHILSGESVVAVAGVNSLAEMKKDFSLWKRLGVQKVVDTFDMDYLTNKNVMKSRKKMKELLEKAGFQYEMRTWDVSVPGNHPELKGFDDYLVYHMRNI